MLIGHLPIVWICDQEAVQKFVVGPPPEKGRLRRWWVFLTQINLAVFHIPGIKNEMADYLSRNNFDERIQMDSELLAREAFAKMDIEMDLSLEALKDFPAWNFSEYQDEYSGKLSEMEPFRPKIFDGEFWYHDTQRLYKEKILVLPKTRLSNAILWCHLSNGHPGIERTMYFFYTHFYCNVTRSLLKAEIQQIVASCKVCIESKPNSVEDRGIIGSLPIPQLVNEIVYVDFIQVDEYNNFDYLFVMVDGLSRFTRIFPCRKKIDGEHVLKMVFENWIQVYGRMKEVYSDNDIRFVSESGWWQSVFRAMNIKVSFATPRRPQANSICERANRSILQNMRCLMTQ